jgi:hypothetical protein
MWNQEKHHPKPPRSLKPSFFDNITNLHIWYLKYAFTAQEHMSSQTCSIYDFFMGDNTRKTHNIMLCKHIS